jgi:hypothetical protein
LKKAFLLFITGYLLNAFKFLIPLWFRWLPAAFQNDMHFAHNRGATNFLLIGDILQFAGIAMVLLALLKRISFYPVYAAFICFVVLMASPLVWDLHHQNILLDHLLHLIGGQPADCFFPFFPWMIYPLAGLMIGRYLQSSIYSMTAIFISGSFLFMASTIMKVLGFHFPEANFYRTWPDESNSHLGFVLIWISIWFWLAKRIGHKQPYNRVNDARVIPLKPVINQQKALIDLLCFCSKNITSIYLAQWILIFWLLTIAGYQELDVFHTVFYGVNITAIVLIIAWLLSKKKKHSNSK